MAVCFNLDRFEACRILIIGDVMLDRYLWGDVERISPEAPVPVFHLRKQSEIPGGAGNVVSNLAGLGCSVTLIGVRGDDAAGQRLNGLLQHAGIQTRILIDSERPTVTKTRIVSHGQQLLRLDEEEISPVNAEIRNEILELVEAHLPKYNAIILSDYGKGLLQAKELAQSVIDLANNHNIPIIIDPKGKDWERYRGATCVTPNTKELELVYGGAAADKEQLVQAMRTTLLQYDLSWLVVTRGALGMCLMNQSQAPVFIPTVARQVYDVSGAGDTVIATLALGVGSGLTFPDGAKLANLAAGIVVGKMGTQPINLFELSASLETTGVDASTGDSTHKIASLNSTLLQVDAWKAIGHKIVVTNGCFDLLHPGHVRLLQQAKALGDRLIVAVNSDASVRRLKGPNRPILTERDRASLLASLDCVDLVVLFEQDTPEDLLQAIKPDLLVKGADYKREEVVGCDIVESHGGAVHLIPLLDGYSTTAIANKVLESHGSSSGKIRKPADLAKQENEIS
jgi:D-beta-D-heptose 7-phosphate kinase / D-beta-D-heptose 1-phosphate adenosyltransferase